jgi:hypothetical protein
MIQIMKKRILKNERGISTLEFIVLLPVYLILLWICLESLFVYNFVIFDGFGDARNEVLEQCYKAKGERILTFEVQGGMPIINDLIDLLTIFYPDTRDFKFKLSSAGK